MRERERRWENRVMSLSNWFVGSPSKSGILRNKISYWKRNQMFFHERLFICVGRRKKISSMKHLCGFKSERNNAFKNGLRHISRSASSGICQCTARTIIVTLYQIVLLLFGTIEDIYRSENRKRGHACFSFPIWGSHYGLPAILQSFRNTVNVKSWQTQSSRF